MARWQPGTRGRLQQVSLDLFSERGFEAVTVAEIARRAAVTERTFYRYFADKREVLFDGQETLLEAFTAGVAAAPQGASPFQLVAAALEPAADVFSDDRRMWSRGRQSVIDTDPSLQERELLKLATLATALSGALRARGLNEQRAGLTADLTVSVFRTAFAGWIAPAETRSMRELQREALATVQALTSS
jgi:AcrR family transcriptional regulator